MARSTGECIWYNCWYTKAAYQHMHDLWYTKPYTHLDVADASIPIRIPNGAEAHRWAPPRYLGIPTPKGF